MGRPKRARAAKEPDYNSATNVKELLDMIGEHIYKKVHLGDADYRGKLYGLLKQAKFSKRDRVHNDNPCLLNYQFDTTVTSTVINPCEHKSVERFSEVSGGECDEKKIRGSNGKDVGACAPFRRLHVCDRNLEQIKTENITTHNLLVDVCMAAQFEGVSISGRYPQYVATYGDLGSTICTVLARSFADIGDIIRGKDLFIGYDEKEKKRRDKLEENLKEIFKKIHSEVTSGRNGVKDRYQNDGDNFFQLREDWWDANRAKVWYAITCGAGTSAQYFRKTCSNGLSWASKQCRCAINDVPTYFDYVPQYLRWFEEWAEDFCRKRKHKLEDAIKKCRFDEDNNPKYCSRNGFDCEKTVRAKGELVKGDDCHKCSVACSNFEPWIKNQKQEFDKQKKKYNEEIKKADVTTIKIGNATINNLYVDEFYKKLKVVGYGDVEKFLKKLNEERICKEPTEVRKERADPVDFTNDKAKETFSHKKYCDTCPWCAKKVKQNGNWTDEQHQSGCPYEGITPFDVSNTTDIKILSREKGKPNILDKYSKLCEKDEKETENWQCHYEDTNRNNCILGKWEEFSENKDVTSYESFFWGWVTEMLKDSIKWRNEHGKCINNKEATKCIGGCKKACDCFQKWVDQKKDEWDAIKIHFDKQKNTDNLTHYQVLQGYLSVFFKEDIIKAYGEDKCDELMESFLNFQVSDGINDTQHSNDPIKILLAHEKDEAKKCTGTHKNDTCPSTDTRARGRAENHDPQSPPVIPPNIFEDEEGKVPVFKDDEVPAPEETEAVQETVAEATDPSVEVCNIVSQLFSDPTKFSDACGLKYGTPNRYWGWKCISDSTTKPGGDGATGSSGATTGGEPTSDKGAICVPPRRRKLYVGKLHDWAKKYNKVANTGESKSPQTSESSQSSSSSTTPPSNPRDGLRDAFIQSAAIETFFLWHRYKKEWDHRNNKTQDGLPAGAQAQELPSLNLGDNSVEKTPQQQLSRGTIHPDFLRQMFYTLADYKDILFSGDKDKKNGYSDILRGDKVIQEREDKIKDAIDKVFPNSGSPSPVRGPPIQHSDKDPQTWWNKHAKHIWNAMVCALTYEDSGEKGEPPTQIDDTGKLLEKIKENGKVTGEYHYENVKLENSVNDGPKPQAPGTSENTHLSKFVLRPPYFRYLEEWGETFCRQRTRMLKNVRDNCTQGDGLCSGDGENCETIRKEDYSKVSNFNCPGCGRECRYYRKWIEKKKIEFTEQENAYDGQKEKCKEENDSAQKNSSFTYDKDFVVKLNSDYNSINSFLQKLGPCKKDNGENDKKNFNDIDKTFQHTEYCDPCSLNGFKCKKGHCGSDAKGNTCTTGKITKEDIKNKTDPNGNIEMVVSDNSGNRFEGDGLEACIEAGIFKGIRKDVWKCVYFCKSDVCGLKKNNNNNNIDDKQIILIRALFKRWLEYFLEDYNKINAKISHCTKKGDGSKCIKECGKKCDCVGKWINIKKKEWKTIRKRYFKQYNGVEQDMKSLVKNFLEGLQSQIPVTINKAIKPCKGLEQFEKSCGFNGAHSSKTKGDDERDLVVCLLEKLEDKAKTCLEQHSAETCTQTTLENPSTTLDDDDPEDLLLEEVENENTLQAKKNMMPTICKDVEEKKVIVVEEPCEEPKEEKEEEKNKGTDSDTPPPTPSSAETEQSDEPKPPQDKALPKPAAPPSPPLPPLKTALVTSTLAWSVGIGFAAFTYFVLKKKTKSTIDLLRVINIPKGDYGIPTLKSTNRYIPYGTDRYKGKTYIYMEGDSGDEKYIGDISSSDITSSESEYEEFDINDIYPYKSPKYKTLIEVVLEPSKRDTPSSDTPMNKFTDNEWKQLKHDFISNMLQNTQNTESNILHDNVDNNTHPTMSRHNVDQKPFIMSIHDRNLYSGEEYSYNINFDVPVSTNINTTTNNNTDDTMCGKNDTYSGIDLINDSLNSDQHIDIYDEILKRKENELFGTNHTKQNTSTNSVAKNTNSDPILNQINLFHKWLDRHRNICEEWDKNKEDILNKLKEEWNKENNNNVDKTYNSHNKPSHNHVLNTDVSIQIDMNNPNTKNEFTNMDTSPDKSTIDTILDDLVKYNEPYYYDFYKDDIYYDVNDDKASEDHINMDHNKMDNNNSDVPTNVQIEMNVINNQELLQNEYPISHM